MDLLDNVATELGFEFHLYVVRDQLFGAQKPRTVHDYLANGKQPVNQQSSSPPSTARGMGTKPWSTDGHADTDNREYTVNVNTVDCGSTLSIPPSSASLTVSGTMTSENYAGRWIPQAIHIQNVSH